MRPPLCPGNSPATAATAGDDQRRVSRADHETPTTATATWPAATRAADSDLEGLPGGQAEIAADLGASAAGARGVSALSPKSEDLIGIRRRHCEIYKATSVGEIKDDRCGLGGRMRGRECEKMPSLRAEAVSFSSP